MMDMKNKIIRIDRKLEFQGVILDFYTDYMKMPDGKVVKWDFIPCDTVVLVHFNFKRVVQ